MNSVVEDREVIKNSRSLHYTIEGTRVEGCFVETLSHPWYHPNCLSRCGEKTTFAVVFDVGTAHLSYLPVALLREEIKYKGFLRSAARERVLPVRYRSELPLCFGSLLVAARILLSLNADLLAICFY
jgi:hypothetical protein